MLERYTKLLEGQILHVSRRNPHPYRRVELGGNTLGSHPDAWKQLADDKTFVLHNDTIRHLKIDIRFKDTGEYKVCAAITRK